MKLIFLGGHAKMCKMCGLHAEKNGDLGQGQSRPI